MTRILWAEDNQGDQSLIEATLLARKHAARVTFVEDGVDFLERCAAEPPAMGVLDIKMPRMSGIEALARVKAGPQARIPMVVFSSSQQPQELAECRRLGAVDVVHKPMDFSSFQLAVGQVLRHLPVRARRVP